MAQSEFGTYKESVLSTIQQTARGVVESYDYASQISALNDGLDSLSEYINLLNGEIRRGIVRDPSTGQDVLGIAISQSLVFSGAEKQDDDVIYYRIDSSLAQTFGMYTSTGWQFWISGRKVGWFDSTDAAGALHVSSAIIENGLRFGEDWIVDQNSNGIGLRFIGS